MEKLMPRAGFARARRPNRTEFSGKKKFPIPLKAEKKIFHKDLIQETPEMLIFVAIDFLYYFNYYIITTLKGMSWR